MRNSESSVVTCFLMNQRTCPLRLRSMGIGVSHVGQIEVKVVADREELKETPVDLFLDGDHIRILKLSKMRLHNGK